MRGFSEYGMDDIRYIQPPTALAAILSRTVEVGFDMGSESQAGALVATLAASKPRGRFLELGTGTGISTAWFLGGMDADSRLITIDTDPIAQGVARDILSRDARVEFVLADALTWLTAQPSHSFDLVFADAMPGKYEGLEDALRLVADGGFYVMDDLLPQPNWPEGHVSRVEPLLTSIQQRPDFRLLRMAWASGIAIAVRIAPESARL